MTSTFLPGLAPTDQKREKVRKRVRPTSRAQYAMARLRLRGRAANVLRWLAAYYNRQQIWPTSAELANYVTADVADWRGEWHWTLLFVRRGLSDLQAKGLAESVEQRPCQVARGKCCVWRVRSR